MAALGRFLRARGVGQIAFWCPGCKEAHAVTVCNGRWTWDENIERPTFSPSVKVTSGHFRPNWKGPNCWCTYNREHPDDPVSFTCSCCHSFVKAGRIEFLGDCTHELKGQTVDLPEFP